jgi:hypothetical protein
MNNRTITSPGIVNTVSYLLKEVKTMYQGVMTIQHSPLKNFDPMVAHMMFQILALVWSGIFAAMLGSYIAFGISAVFHIFFISGVLVTVLVFREGNKRSRAVGYNGRAPGGEHE